MTDIEQKAREVRKSIIDTIAIEPPFKILQKEIEGEVLAAIQSAVDDERLENRKLFSIGMSDLRREPNYDRICDKVSQIDEAIRAKGQKVLDNNTKVR